MLFLLPRGIILQTLTLSNKYDPDLVIQFIDPKDFFMLIGGKYSPTRDLFQHRPVSLRSSTLVKVYL